MAKYSHGAQFLPTLTLPPPLPYFILPKSTFFLEKQKNKKDREGKGRADKKQKTERVKEKVIRKKQAAL